MEDRIKWIDTARTIGVLWVICVAHMDEYTDLDLSAAALKYCNMIVLALFMLVSGYCMRKYEFKSAGEVCRFYIRRLRRLYPLFAISVCMLCAISILLDITYISDIKQLAYTLTTTAWIFGRSPSTLWFVIILFFFYFMTPILKSQNKLYKRVCICSAVTLLLLILSRLTSMDIRAVYYFPFYCLGLYTDELLDGRIVKKHSNRALFLFAVSAGLLIFSLWVLDYITPTFHLKWLVRICLIWVTCFVGAETLIQLSMRTPKYLYRVTGIIAFCSMCMYLFHRQFFAIWFYSFGTLPVWVAYLVMLPLLIVCSYLIQKAYDLILSGACNGVKNRSNKSEQLQMEDEHMDYDKIINDDAFFKWKDYDPLDIQYMRYAESNPSVIAAGHKIYDVYLGFCNARASLMFADSEDFGDIAGDSETSKLYAKCHFLQNALIEYAICLDLSWQVVWAYIQPSSLEYLMKQEYKDMEKECDRDNVLAQLKCAISQNGRGVAEAQAILDIVKNFDNDETTLKLRSIYNKIKHQGTIHYEGLGANFDHLSVVVNGKVPQMLHRDSYSVEEIKDLLYSYHVSFQKYMNDLIKIIMPEGYLNNKMDFVDAMNATVKMAGVE